MPRRLIAAVAVAMLTGPCLAQHESDVESLRARARERMSEAEAHRERGDLNGARRVAREAEELAAKADRMEAAAREPHRPQAPADARPDDPIAHLREAVRALKERGMHDAAEDVARAAERLQAHLHELHEAGRQVEAMRSRAAEAMREADERARQVRAQAEEAHAHARQIAERARARLHEVPDRAFEDFDAHATKAIAHLNEAGMPDLAHMVARERESRLARLRREQASDRAPQRDAAPRPQEPRRPAVDRRPDPRQGHDVENESRPAARDAAPDRAHAVAAERAEAVVRDLTARIEQLNRRITELQQEIDRLSRRDPPRR